MKIRIQVHPKTIFSLLWLLTITTLAFAQAVPGGINSAKGINPPSGNGKEQSLTLPAPAAPVKSDEGSITFVGTATVIIRYGGMTILTDPNFLHKGDHVHLGYGLTSERLTNPAFDLDKLPGACLLL